MRYLKTLLVAMLALFGTATYAQDRPADAIGEGYYLLYNVGKDSWLGKGNGWGTQASMLPESATLAVEAKLVNGKYFLRTGVNNNNFGLEHLNDGTVYTDQSRNKQSTWEFKQVGDDNGPVYNIISGENHGGGAGAFLCANAGNTILDPGQDGSSDFAKWKVIKLQDGAYVTDLNNQMMSATSGTAIDVTRLILNQNFGYFSNIFWTMNAGNQNMHGGAADNHCAESWQSTFTMSQDIAVPNGSYVIKAQAALTDYTNAYDGKDYPVVYANDASVPFCDMEPADRGTSMTQLSGSFSAGKYEVSPLKVLVTNGKLTLGVKGTRTNTWCIWDNFRLEYQGMAPLLKDLLDKANELMPTLNETNAAELKKAIDAAQAVYDNASSTNSEIEAAMEALQDAYNTADAENIAKKKAIEVLNNVPYVLFPEDFKWALEDGEKYNKLTGEQKMDLDRDFKVYKNNNGKYQLASRVAVLALVKLLEYADADEKTKKAIKARMDELGIEGYDEMLADALTKYTRLVVETHGVGAALAEQNDPNYSRMYTALEEAGLDTDAFIGFLLTGASDEVTEYGYDGTITGNEWTSSDGLVTITRESGKDITAWDPSYYYYWDVEDGEDWTITCNSDEYELSEISLNALDLLFTVNGGEQLNSFWYWIDGTASVSGKTATVHIDEVLDMDDPTALFMVTLADKRDPWNLAGVDRTISDIYEMLHDYADGYWGFDANFTAHIKDPNLTEGGDAWESTWGGILSSESLTDSEGSNEYPYFDANTWNESGTMEVDAHQTIQLPPGRYMLTAAGRASQNNKVEKKGTHAGHDFTNYVWEGPFTEPGAQDPANYFQLYATTFEGKTVAKSFLELEGNKGGIFDNGWNDASVFFTMPSVGDVTIGVRAATNVKERWASATRFRLTRLGDATVYLNEDETLTDELNWDAVGNEIGAFAPTDFLLKKKMEAGKWYSISVPGDIDPNQIVREFGEGTQLALPIDYYNWNEEGSEKLVLFAAYNPTQYYFFTDIFGNPSLGIMANMPYLIKPAQVKASNRYLFKDITSTDTHNVYKDGMWSWGAISLPYEYDPEEGNWFETNDANEIKFYPNYKYGVNYENGYTIEVTDTMKAYTCTMVADDAEIVGALLFTLGEDGWDYDTQNDILIQQLLDIIELAQTKAEWYPGIPAAMTKKLTTVPEIQTLGDVINAIAAVKSAIVEAKKAYEPSKQFNALMAQANDLLATEHSELVEGADDAFKKKIETLQRTFDRQLTAEPINGLIEQLEAAIAEYKEQIFVAGTIEDGNYYIMNVGTGKYLNGGNSWGTRASLTDNREFFTTAKLEDGAYTLESRFSNGGEQYYLGPNYYVDNGNPMPLTITAISEKAFTISCTGESGFGYLGWDGSESTEVRVLTDAASENAQWVFVSVDDVIADIPNATVEEPKDATPLIKDAYFGRNHRDVAAWEGDGFSTNSTGNTVAEKWGGNSQTFDIHQTVTVPDGVYRLSFYGYYRYNNTEENTTQVAIDSHKDGTEVLNSFVYANDVEVALKSIADDKAVEVLGESNLPFSMDAAGQAFAQGLYKNEILVKVEGGKLVLGIKKINHPGCDWTVWDDFILTYYGDTTIEDVQNAYPAETGATTGINEVNTSVNTGAIYNLNGVRVNNMTKKGVYIVNGKKIVVK